jgi:hypothetical protein
MMSLKLSSLGGVALLVLIASCSGHSDGENRPSKPPNNFIATNANIPNPCDLISPELSEDLIGLKGGRQTDGPEPHDASTDVECEWDNGGANGPHRKRGTLDLNAHIDLMRIAGGDPYSGAKIYYQRYVAGKTCKKINIEAAETCWYVEPGISLGLVLRDGYRTVWLTCVAFESPSLKSRNLPKVAARAAREIMKDLN